VRSSGAISNIVPIAAKNREGHLQPVAPLMDAPVRLPAQPNRTIDKVLQILLNQLTAASGKRVGLWGPLGRNYLQTMFPEEFDGTARELLEQTFAKVGGHALWLLQCNPRSEHVR
jgi:hypothetical protein